MTTPGMHISDIIKPGEPTFSFEFFPPKNAEAAAALYETIKDLSRYRPSFVSVTYGAGGSTRELTHDLVVKIRETTHTPPVPHLTCVCHTADEITATLERYASVGIGNILALRGDPPADMPGFDRSGDSFRHAADLVPEGNGLPQGEGGRGSGLHLHPVVF